MLGTVFMIIAGTALVTGILLEFWAVITAPLGYQDETGFHVGVPQAEKEDGIICTNPS